MSNQTKHTPGPWHQCDGQIYGPNPDFDPKDLVSNSEILIADVAPEGAALTEYDENNARLIAAAPELLEALNELRTSLIGTDLARGYIYAKDRKRIEIAMDDARAALTKAKGAQ